MLLATTLLALYLILFVITWGAAYGYFVNNYPSIASPLNCRENVGFAVLFALWQPIAFVVALFCSGFFYHGLQWWGPPRKNGRRMTL